MWRAQLQSIVLGHTGSSSAHFTLQDKWNADWSGRLTPSAVMLLSLYASQHNITKLEQAIV